MIQVLIINSHSLEDLVGFLHYLIEDERNDFIWLDLKVDISVTSSLFLSLSLCIVRMSLSAPEVSLATTFLHIVHRLLEFPTVSADKPHRSRSARKYFSTRKYFG